MALILVTVKGCAKTLTRLRLILLSCSGTLIAALLGCATSTYLPYESSVAPTANPLVAQYSVTHYHPGFSVWVEFGTDTNYGRQTSVVSESASVTGGAEVKVLVAGMLPQTTYHMRAHVDSPTGPWLDQDQTFTTGALPTDPPIPQFTVSGGAPGSSTAPSPGVELLSLVNTSGAKVMQAVVADQKGNVIWFCPVAALPIKPLDNGHFIVVTFSDLLEIDLACNTIRDISLPQMNQSLQAHGYSFPPLNVFHHDVVVLPNGHWITLAQITKNFDDLPGYPGTTGVLGDVLLDIDPSGEVTWAWSVFDHTTTSSPPDVLDINRHLLGLPDWTHSNAIVYTADGNLLLSVRHQSWILKIDYANGTGNGDILWRLGQEGDFTLLGADSTQWFYAQHFPYIVSSNGSQMSLAVWDNGNLRIEPDGTACGSTPTAPACYSRATIFQVDEQSHLASLLWQNLPGFYSQWGGSIGSLANGNVEFDMTSPVDQATPVNQSTSQIMEMTQTDNPQVVWQMNISGANAYRGHRIPSLYPGVTWQK
jgi:arylsulfate sulfotransferase